MTDSFNLAIMAVFALAGFVKGVTGLGLPTVSVGLLGLFMAPAQAAALMVLPSAVTNIWQGVVGGGFLPLLRRLAPLLLGLCLGTWLGAGLLERAELARLGLGLALVVYGVLGLSPLPPLRMSARWEAPAGGAAGVATGVVTAATGVFVLPAVPFIQALGLGRDQQVQALGLSFTVSTLALGVALAGGGVLDAGVALGSAVALAPALLGMALGQWLRRFVPPTLFRRLVAGALLVLGLQLLWRALG